MKQFQGMLIKSNVDGFMYQRSVFCVLCVWLCLLDYPQLPPAQKWADRQTERQTDRQTESYLLWNALLAYLEFRASKEENTLHEPFLPQAIIVPGSCDVRRRIWFVTVGCFIIVCGLCGDCLKSLEFRSVWWKLKLFRDIP